VNFDPPGIVRSHLTMLVVDLRNSSAFIQYLRLSQVEAFLDELSAKLVEVVDDIVGYDPQQWRIVKFTGDGFLVVFAEPDDVVRTDASERARRADGPAVPPVLGPARALAVARHLRASTYQMLRAWNAFALLRQGSGDVGLVSGIVDGLVSYGQIAMPAVDHHDAGGEPVIRAFRFAQIRDNILIGGDADRILVCDTTAEEVQRFLDSAASVDHPLVTRQIDGVTFRPVDLPGPLKGIAEAACLQAIWQVPETVTA
jgi:class 3 adenylate cyclase